MQVWAPLPCRISTGAGYDIVPNMRVAPIDNIVPLTPPAFYVLLVLAERELHGYGIMQQCNIDSRGSVNLTSGNQYPLLKRLERTGYIQRAELVASTRSPFARGIYRITEMGKFTLRMELDRFNDALELGQHRLKLK